MKSDTWRHVELRGDGGLTDLVVEFRKLHLHLVPLEIMILGLLAHRRDQVELTSHRVRLLMTDKQTG